MWDNVLSKMPIFYQDTDSAVAYMSDINYLKNENPRLFGNNFGQMKNDLIDPKTGIEKKCNMMIVPGPKCYGMWYDNGKGFINEIKARCRGINRKRDLWFSGIVPLEALEVKKIFINKAEPADDILNYIKKKSGEFELLTKVGGYNKGDIVIGNSVLSFDFFKALSDGVRITIVSGAMRRGVKISIEGDYIGSYRFEIKWVDMVKHM